MCVTLSLASLISESTSEATITQEIPIQLQRRGVEARLAIGGADTARPDPALIQTIAFARIWFDELESGRVRNIAEIAKRYGFSERHVSSLLRLAFLSPETVYTIEKGTQTSDLTVEMLTKRITLPREWNMQKQVFAG